MQYSEAERKKLINKLKTVKDAAERDRIIWALAGLEEKKSEEAKPSPPAGLRGKTAPGKPVPRDAQGLPGIAVDAKRLMGLAVPVFFLIFGIVYLIQAILSYLATRNIETELSRMIMGVIFVVVGLAGIFKALRAGGQVPDR